MKKFLFFFISIFILTGCEPKEPQNFEDIYHQTLREVDKEIKKSKETVIKMIEDNPKDPDLQSKIIEGPYLNVVNVLANGSIEMTEMLVDKGSGFDKEFEEWNKKLRSDGDQKIQKFSKEISTLQEKVD